MEEWKEYRLNDVCEVINGRAYKQEELLEEGKYRVLRVGNIFQGNNWYYSDIELPEDKYCYNGDLLYAWSCGFAPYIWKGEKTIYHYHIWKLKENKEVVDRKFLYFYLIVNTKRFLGGTHGSVMLHLTKKEMEEQLLKLPSLETQKRIASILSSLDDKIELNRKINANLEAQAQALFKSWFVDFEPFKDQPFVESELGMIPEGWRVYCLSEFLPVITGKKDANVAKGGPYPFFSCSQDFGWTDDYSFEGNAILVAGNGDFNVKMYNGKFEAYQRTYVLIPHNPQYTAWLFYAVKYHLNDITSAARGSVIKFITKGNLADFKFTAPQGLDKAEIIEKFDCFRRIIASNEQESRRLASLRDALLPRLMSGELNVFDKPNDQS